MSVLNLPFLTSIYMHIEPSNAYGKASWSSINNSLLINGKSCVHLFLFSETFVLVQATLWRFLTLVISLPRTVQSLKTTLAHNLNAVHECSAQ